MRLHTTCVLAIVGGGGLSSKTTPRNIDDHRRGIDVPWLSKTIQDCVVFARKLGFRYLWVDSLCIVQDDLEDWRRESARMSSVYRNAIVTLAATRSPNHAGGCFSEISPDYQAIRVGSIGVEGGTAPVHARRQIPHCSAWYNLSPEDTEPRGTDFPLLTRAWAYQERLLSPRVLHFTPNELFWECTELSECECLSADSFYGSKDLSSGFPKARHAESLAAGAAEMSERWHDIVEEYSPLGITFDKDRFPALSGLAKQMQQFRSDRYLAGMWEADLPNTLLWAVDLNEAWPSRLPGVPTWTWVSVTGGISTDYCGWLENLEKVYAKVLSAHCTTVGGDPHGEVTSGTIQLSAPLFPATLVYDNANSASSDAAIEYGIRIFGKKLWRFNPDYMLCRDGAAHLPHGARVYCLMVIRQNQWGDIFLVLRRAVGQRKGVYERIGVAAEPMPKSLQLVKWGWRSTVTVV